MITGKPLQLTSTFFKVRFVCPKPTIRSGDGQQRTAANCSLTTLD
jgi:hypothetical protein